MLSSRRVLRSTRRWRGAGRPRGGAARAELPLALLAASEDSVCAGAAPTALRAPPLPALSFVPPPELSAIATMAARTQPATPRAGTSGRSAKRLRGAVRSKPRSTRSIQSRPERRLHRRRLGAHVAHERGELGLGGGVAGERGLQRLELGGHGGIEGGLTTAHDRPLEVG